MSVTLISLKHYDEFNGTSGGGVNYLLATYLDKIRTEIVFDVEWSTKNKSLIFSSSSKTITRSDSGGSFISDGFKIGDTLVVVDATLNSGTKTITDITATTITVAESLTTETDSSCSLYGTTPITAVNYLYNTIENSELDTFESKIDTGILQKYSATGLVTSTTGTTTSMYVATPSKAWSNGDASIITVNANPYKQRLKIVHNWYFIPSESQIANDFTGTKCLKYIAKVECKYTANDPVIPHTSAFTSIQGNTGKYGQYYNLGLPIYYDKSSVKYTNSSGTIITSPSYCEETNVEVIVKTPFNSPNTPSINSGTSIVLNQLHVPVNTSEYTGNSNDLVYNYKYDRVKTSPSVSSVNGGQLGTIKQSIKNLTCTVLSTQSLKVNYTISPSSLLSTYFAGKSISDRRFIISLTVADSTTGSTSGEYHNAILIDDFQLQCSSVDNTLLTLPEQVVFYEHPNTVLKPYTDFKGWVEDGVLSRCRFRLKTSANALLDKLTVQILAQHTTGTTSNTSLVSVGDLPNSAAYDSINDRMYITNYASYNVYVIRCSDKTVINTIPVGVSPIGIAFSPINNSMYVANSSGDSVSVISCNTMSVTATIALTPFLTPSAVAYDSINNRIYVSQAGGSTVVVIDCNTNTILTTITVGNAPANIAYDSIAGRMYVTNQSSSSISVISCSNYSVSTISTSSNPYGIAFDPINYRIYFTRLFVSSVYSINCGTNTVNTNVISSSYDCRQLIYNDNKIYISNFVDGKVSVINTISDSIIASLSVGSQPLGMAADTLRNLIYVCNQNDDTSSILSVEENTNSEFILEEKIFDTSSISPVNFVQPILLTGITRGYHLVDGDKRNDIELKRNTDVDTTGYSGYELNYPFKLRWEDWRTLLGVDSHFPLNNHDWQQYSKDTYWDVKYRLIFDVEDSFGNLQQYIRTCDIGIQDYEDAGTTITFTTAITTFSTDGVKNFSGRISKSENTLVKALFTGDFSTMPTGTTSFYGILALDNDPVGGTTYTRIISSQTGRETDSPWIGLPLSTNNARITINGTTSVLLEAVIDYTKIDMTLPNYFITARLGFY